MTVVMLKVKVYIELCDHICTH